MKALEKVIAKKENQDCNNPMEFYNLPQEEQEKIKLWIELNVKPYLIKNYNSGISSYNVKHDYEHHKGTYYTNGVFKGAFHACGLPVKEYGTLNWELPLGGRYNKHRFNVLRKG